MAEDNRDDLVSKIKALMEEEGRKEHPDYGITVYCDQHLGVKMLQATTWTSLEYGDSSADANPYRRWSCPKEHCHRSYEPLMFGYHWHSGEMGSRVQLNHERQPRGNHPGLPFMYIGRIGEGRRFLCPLYKCDEIGPEVAAAVLDEEVLVPADPSDALRNSERKRATEMRVFKAFISASSLLVDEGSVENRDPDYPDISCTISGGCYYFELGQIINQEVAEKLNADRHKTDGGFSYDLEKPFINVVKSKVTKRYLTDGAPVDLILHFDLRLGNAATVARLCEKHQKLLNSLTATGQFKRARVFDNFRNEVIWAGPQ